MSSEERFVRAAVENKLSEIQEAIRTRSVNIDCTDNQLKTALFKAAQYNRKSIVQWLVTNGANVNKADNDGETPLYRAAVEGHEDIVKILAENGANIETVERFYRMTPLMAASFSDRWKTVEYLINRGADVNKGHVQGYNAGNAGQMPIHCAASSAPLHVVELFIARRVNVNIKQNNGDTPLHRAALYGFNQGRISVVKCLLRNGANINITNNEGKKPVDVLDCRSRISTEDEEELRNLLRGIVTPPRPVVPPVRHFRPYSGPASMTFRDTSRSVLASGRTVAAHVAAAPGEERKVQELALILDELCKRGEFRDLSTVTRVLAKPTGQSVVFEGVYQDQPVAVKVFLDRTTKNTAENEVALLRRCAHQHVLRTLIMYEYNRRALLVMPLADGDLNSVMEKAEGPLPIALVTRYVKQVATALAFLHDEKRVAHLDLKPGNVFIAKSDKRALLADFGMAMDITDITRDQLLNCGTPCFMAPELWADRLGEPVQRGNRAKVDVYAFGCMVWQLLTRQLPFQREIENDGWGNDNFRLLATAVRHDRRSPAGMLETRWPEPLRRVIQASCTYEPERRPTMAQLLSKAEYLG